MKHSKPTLHIFGGNELIEDCESIAAANGWRIVIRTGKRFISALPRLGKSTELLVGNDLDKLLQKGGLPSATDIGISLSAPWIISKSLINQFGGRIYNLHYAPLPLFRGAGGSSWRILMGDRRGGVCLHRLVPGIDAGDILAKVEFDFPNHLRTPREFDNFIFVHAKELFANWLNEALINGGASILNSVPQNDHGEYWPRLHTDTHGWIDWRWSLTDITSFCNAFSDPYGGALTTVSEKIIRLHKVSYTIEKGRFHPFQTGLIFKIEANTFAVAHHEGILLVENYTLTDSFIRLGDRLFSPIEKLEEALKSRIQYKPDGTIFKN